MYKTICNYLLYKYFTCYGNRPGFRRGTFSFPPWAQNAASPSGTRRADSNIGAATSSGALSLEKLEAMTSGSTGLDMIAIPGDTPAATISGIIAVEMKQPDTMREPFDP